MRAILLVLKLNDMKIGDLAKLLGVKQPQINSWMNGERPIPIKHIFRLSEIFDVSETFFIGELDEKSIIDYYKKTIEKEIGKKIEIKIIE